MLFHICIILGYQICDYIISYCSISYTYSSRARRGHGTCRRAGAAGFCAPARRAGPVAGAPLIDNDDNDNNNNNNNNVILIVCVYYY